MLKPLNIIFAAILFAACTVHAVDEGETVLWWMFNDNMSISDNNGSGASYTIDTLTGRGDANGLGVNGIRISAYDGDTLLGYLKVSDADGVASDFYPMPGLEEDAHHELIESWDAGPSYALLTPYASTPGVSFMIELGNWDSERGPGNEWMILAVSEEGTPTSLQEFINNSIDMQSERDWTGGSFNVPEPTSGLLMLIGASLLALRRRRRS